jgi:hypothetical protein
MRPAIGDNVSTVVLNHLWKESLEHPEMSYGVDFDDFLDFTFGVFQEVVLWHNDCVINQNSHITNFLQNFSASFRNILSTRHINTKNVTREIFINIQP